MIEKPDIADERIISGLQRHYPMRVHSVEFLPRGLDSAAWSYRVNAEEGIYFLKLRKGIPNPAGILVPALLREQGIEQVIVPLPTKEGKSWAAVDDFDCIVYPFLAAEQVMDVGMSDAHWIEFGSFLGRLHSVTVPAGLMSQLKREDYVPARIEWVSKTHAEIKTTEYDDPFQRDLAGFWKEEYAAISTILERTRTLAKRMQQTSLEYVLCHADIHTANVLRTDDDRIFIVDWDECLMAPRERDLMFIIDGLKGRERDLFFRGYGEVEIDSLALAYYRYDWCVEDMGGFADRIFTTERLGDKTREESLGWFKTLFAPGNSIETALSTDVEHPSPAAQARMR